MRATSFRLRRTAAWTAVLVSLILVGAMPAAAQDVGESIPGIGPAGDVQRLHTGFGFTEGPAADAGGNVYFTDVRNQRIHKVDRERNLSTFREESGRANGLMFNSEGELVACQMIGRLVKLSRDGSRLEVLADQYEGNRFNAPNDLVIDRPGGVYFTDPAFGAGRPLPQPVHGVYYRAPDGTVTRLIDDLRFPNGVILSPDEKTLYVVPTGQPEVMAYPVSAPGTLETGRVLCRLKQAEGRTGGGGDGLTVDTDGNLYIT
ncbi:MAG: SMP-30/gluconolactonase/LRE family protein, partial [Pirellulales bacterium]